MKKIFFSIVIFLVATASEAQFKSAKITAAGLTCAMCTKAIYNSLGKVPAVSKVDADIKNSSFLVTFKKGSTIDPRLLSAAVEEAGFSVARLSLTGDFDNVPVNEQAQVMIDGKTYQIASARISKLDGERTFYITDKKLGANNGPYHVTL